MRVSNLEDKLLSPEILAKVDTGADVTAIPFALVDQCRLSQTGQFAVEGYDRHTKSLPYYDVILRVAHLKLSGLSTITFSENYILIGRDALNYLRLVLDGPAPTLEILA